MKLLIAICFFEYCKLCNRLLDTADVKIKWKVRKGDSPFKPTIFVSPFIYDLFAFLPCPVFRVRALRLQLKEMLTFRPLEKWVYALLLCRSTSRSLSGCASSYLPYSFLSSNGSSSVSSTLIALTLIVFFLLFPTVYSTTCCLYLAFTSPRRSPIVVTVSWRLVVGTGRFLVGWCLQSVYDHCSHSTLCYPVRTLGSPPLSVNSRKSPAPTGWKGEAEVGTLCNFDWLRNGSLRGLFSWREQGERIQRRKQPV